MLPNIIQSAVQYVSVHPERFLEALRLHLLLSGCALSVAVSVALPLGILLAGSPKLNRGAAGLFTGLRVIPSLAVLALMLPLAGTGFVPSLMALVLLAIPPVLIHTAQGISQVSPEIREAAAGMGMSEARILGQVTLPLALPAILTGLRTATVEVLASATLAALVGGGGFGNFIVNGLGMYNFPLLLVGALPVVLLVMLAEGGFGMLERMTTRYRAC
jgi:osmoprotectant transport system permease protein